MDRAGIRQRLRPTTLLGQEVFLLAPEDAFIQIAVHLVVNHQLSLSIRCAAWWTWPCSPNRGLIGRWWSSARAWRLAAAGTAHNALSRACGRASRRRAESEPGPLLAGRAVHRPVAGATGENLTRSRRRLLSQLALVNRPADVAALLARRVWPEQQWLAARYGRAELGVRLRHTGAVVRGKVRGDWGGF